MPYVLEFLELWNNPAVVLELFDAIVKPILTYTSEVWCQQFTKQISNTDIQKCDSLEFEKLHNTICKQILGVGKYSNNLAARLELGRTPISMFVKRQVLNYWNKLEKSPHDSILYNCLLSEKSVHNQNIASWYTVVVNTMGDNMCNIDNINEKYIVSVALKNEQVLKQNIVEYLEKISSSTAGYKMRTYGKIKTVVKMEPYMMSKLNKSEKIQISKFRVGDHNLHIETGRHCKPKTPIDKKTCCNCNKVEDEVHFLVDCLLYDEPRVKYKFIAPHGYHDSTAKFVEI